MDLLLKQFNMKRDVFVFAGGWYLIHEPDGILQFDINTGWLLVQDGGTGFDGIAEFRAQYSVKIKNSLDFSKDGKATFILHVIDAECYIRQLS